MRRLTFSAGNVNGFANPNRGQEIPGHTPDGWDLSPSMNILVSCVHEILGCLRKNAHVHDVSVHICMFYIVGKGDFLHAQSPVI